MSRSLVARAALAVLLIFTFSSMVQAKKKRRKARPKSVKAVILPIKVKGLDLATAKSLGKVMGKTVMKELNALSVVRVLKGKQIKAKLKRLKKKKVLVTGCEEKVKCVKAVGRNLRAKVIYYSRLSKADDGVDVTVLALDVSTGKEIRKAVERAKADKADVARAATWAARKASSPLITTMLKGRGRLLVNCDQTEADLYINGKSFGKRTNKGFKVGAGVFDLQVKKEGFVSFHDVVIVTPNKELKVDAKLTAKSRPVGAVVAAVDKTDKKSDPKPKKDLPAWAVFDKTKKDPKSKKEPGGTAVPVDKKVDKGPKLADKTPPPYLPADEVPKPVKEEDDDKVAGGAAWYSTWWFWTAVGVVAVGGIGGGLYAGGVFDGDSGSTATGSALVSWQ